MNIRLQVQCQATIARRQSQVITRRIIKGVRVIRVALLQRQAAIRHLALLMLIILILDIIQIAVVALVVVIVANQVRKSQNVLKLQTNPIVQK